jgi:hypothetical protein
MDRLRLPLILAVLVLAGLVRGPTAVLASCAAIPQLGPAIRNAPAVFVGTVTSVDHGGRVATVHVEDVWKGRVGANVQVVGTPELNAAATSVDRIYSAGQKYLFIPFAGGGDRYQDNNCTLTQPFSVGLAAYRPSAAAAPKPAAETSSWTPLAGVGGLIVLIAGMFMGVFLRHRHATRKGGTY